MALQYQPGKGLEERGRKLGQARSTKIKQGAPPRGKGVRIGLITESNELAVSIGDRIFRRRVFKT